MKASKIKAMQAEIDENRASGAPVVPSYNNFKQELEQLNEVYGRAYEFSFTFSEPEVDGTGVRRNIAAVSYTHLDIKLFFMTGLYLNSAWELLFYLILSCLLGLGFAALRRSQRLPFGPSIAAACFIMTLYGNVITRWYTGLF